MNIETVTELIQSLESAEAEKDAQAYFDRKYAPLDEELMVLHKWFWEQSEAERAAAGIKVG